MLPLKERQKNREYIAKVNAGVVEDTKVTHGTNPDGRVLGDNGEPVPGTAPGEGPAAGDGNKGKETVDTVDYAKMTVPELDEAIKTKTKPEGWDGMNRDEKRAAIAGIPNTPATSW